MRKNLLVTAGCGAMVVVAAGVVLMTLALYRYGGVEGVTDRVRMQISAERPHDDFVPTPETAGGDPDPAQLLAFTTLALTPTAMPAAPAVTDTTAAAATAAAPSATTTGNFLSADQARQQLASLSHPLDVPFGAAKPAALPTATTRPTAKPSATVAQSATAAPATKATASAFPPTMRLDGLAHYWQTWNNCGPATLSMNLSFFGIKLGQDKLGAALKPEKDDKNVSPQQLADYASSQGLKAVVLVNGDSNRLKALLQAGIPVIVETWYEPKPNDGMGHYKLVNGYDDAGAATGGGYWIAYDSYDSHGIQKGDPYQGIHFPYDSFDQLWKVFGRTYIPIYDDKHAPAVEKVLGADLDYAQMWRRALAEDQAYTRANPKDAFGWFNIGTDYTNLGDYKAASQAYDAARRLKLPWRMLWYQFGPFQAYYEVGRYQEVIDLADATIKTAVNDEELFYWKGLAQQALGDPASAKASLEQAVKLRPTYQDAVDALGKLP